MVLCLGRCPLVVVSVLSLTCGSGWAVRDSNPRPLARHATRRGVALCRRMTDSCAELVFSRLAVRLVWSLTSLSSAVRDHFVITVPGAVKWNTSFGSATARRPLHEVTSRPSRCGRPIRVQPVDIVCIMSNAQPSRGAPVHSTEPRRIPRCKTPCWLTRAGGHRDRDKPADKDLTPTLLLPSSRLAGQESTGKDAEDEADEQRHPQGRRDFRAEEANGRAAPVLQDEDDGDKKERHAGQLASAEGQAGCP